jgi:two-component system, OmpR family, sensor histidine kinase KdpD
MTESERRPDPDELLRRVQREEAQARRGKLKIFFGFAPGVGKTYRMLQVARDLVSDQKLDVVVGIVETHRRTETAAMTLGLELLPRRRVEYRGKTLDELDLDAALARKPQLLLVDELPHTNAPGSRHAKRWQDVMELLERGIDVFTTMNVQHVESLNDVVSQITRIQVRETVPDSVLDEADAIELVDIAPEELLTRLAEGKVYLPDQARRAAEHFFQRGNLLALRELALRRTAQHVDEDVLEYRQEHGVAATWPAGERIMVCVGAAPSSGRLIRTAARMAAGLRCPWIAVYVEPSPLTKAGDEDRQRLEAHLRIAESLGATVTRLSGRTPGALSTASGLSGAGISQALLDHARKHNVTRIVIGKPTHSRLLDRLRGSLLDEVVRGSDDIDVHVISGGEREEPGGGVGASRSSAAPRRPGSPPGHYLIAAGLVAITLGVTLATRAVLDLPDLEMLYLLTVMITALWFGRGPSVFAAALCVVCYDFFFVPPHYTFAVADSSYLLTFLMMFGVSLVLSELTSRLKGQEREALAREERTAVLYALSRDLADADTPAAVAAVGARHAAAAFTARAVVLGPAISRDGDREGDRQADDGGDDGDGGDGILRPLAAAPPDAVLDVREQIVARWAFEHAELAGLGTDTLPGSASLGVPLRLGASPLGVLSLLPEQRVALRADQRAFLDVLSRQLAGGLERVRLAEAARSAALRARTEEMRSSLLSAVSHDLRTPLASITGAATSLRDDVNLAPATRDELVDAICDEAERLERLVANLLDMTRLESGALSLKRDWVPVDELVSSALTRLEARLGDRPVHVSLSEDLPLVHVDPVLFEQLLVNLLENAAKYTPPGSALEISARVQLGGGGANAAAEAVLLDVRDHGPGIPPGEEEKVFAKFFRGQSTSSTGVPGAGLGLPICRGVAEAHGGWLRVIPAAERDDGGDGARFRVSIPSGGAPQLLPPEAGDERDASGAPDAPNAAPARGGAGG